MPEPDGRLNLVRDKKKQKDMKIISYLYKKKAQMEEREKMAFAFKKKILSIRADFFGGDRKKKEAFGRSDEEEIAVFSRR